MIKQNINIPNTNNQENNLTNQLILNTFISSLKFAQKQQENKKKNYKKLINLFSVRVQKYDDTSSSQNKTDEKFKTRKNDFHKNIIKRRRRSYKPVYNHCKQNKKDYCSSIDALNINAIKIAKDSSHVDDSIIDREYEYECNSDSSIYTKEKRIYSDDELDNVKKRFSYSKTIQSERLKIVKHKFSKQMDFAKAKKFTRDNFNIETSLYNSLNSTERKSNQNNFNNYYLVKKLEDDKELLGYNESERNHFKYDENYKCYYSLDHKSRIIYIKPSPNLLSSINSILTSKIVSNKTTKNISNEQSQRFSPRKEGNIIMNIDHDTIVEKLRDLELARKYNEMQNEKNIIINSSEDEEEDSSDN